jgi:hypothetical protein
MPACNDPQIVGQIVYTKLYIYIYVCMWMVVREIRWYIYDRFYEKFYLYIYA